MKPYYYIFRVGGSHPRIKHPTLEAAHEESLRLAAQHPGDSFEILQCLGTTRTINPQTFWVDSVKLIRGPMPELLPEYPPQERTAPMVASHWPPTVEAILKANR